MPEHLWTILVVVCPIILAIGVAYAMMRNRKESTPGKVAQAERGSRELYEKLDRADGGHGDKP